MPSPRLLCIAVLASLPLVAAPGVVRADGRPICAEGTFVVQGEPLRPRGGLLPPDTVALTDGHVAIESAGTAPAKLRATRDGTRVRARFGGSKPAALQCPFCGKQFRNELAAWSWNVLTGLTGQTRERPLRLKARISADCA